MIHSGDRNLYSGRTMQDYDDETGDGLGSFVH